MRSFNTELLDVFGLVEEDREPGEPGEPGERIQVKAWEENPQPPKYLIQLHWRCERSTQHLVPSAKTLLIGQRETLLQCVTLDLLDLLLSCQRLDRSPHRQRCRCGASWWSHNQRHWNCRLDLTGRKPRHWNKVVAPPTISAAPPRVFKKKGKMTTNTERNETPGLALPTHFIHWSHHSSVATHAMTHWNQEDPSAHTHTHTLLCQLLAVWLTTTSVSLFSAVQLHYTIWSACGDEWGGRSQDQIASPPGGQCQGDAATAAAARGYTQQFFFS